MPDTTTGPARTRDVWVGFGLSVAALSAAVSSFAGLRSLAIYAGWHELLAPLLPLTVDAYAMAATRVWLTSSTESGRARRFARSNSVGAILLSLLGNAAAHLITADLLTVTWHVVVAVGSVPALILGLVAHLATLRGQVDMPAPATEPGTDPPVPSRTRYDSADELLDAARAADAAHRAKYGRPISRDALRKELRVSAARTSAALKQLRTKR